LSSPFTDEQTGAQRLPESCAKSNDRARIYELSEHLYCIVKKSVWSLTFFECFSKEGKGLRNTGVGPYFCAKSGREISEHLYWLLEEVIREG
jgi:hypothetical protein